MVKSFLNNKVQFQDLVAGKGDGLVILMHGPPGVGKTLTAGNAEIDPAFTFSHADSFITPFKNAPLKPSKSLYTW